MGSQYQGDYVLSSQQVQQLPPSTNMATKGKKALQGTVNKVGNNLKTAAQGHSSNNNGGA